MKTKATRSIRVAAAVAATLAVLGGSNLQGQRASSLTDQEIQSSETETAMKALIRDNTFLRDKLQESESLRVELQKNLGISSAEQEVLKRKINELKARFDALGIDTVDTAGLQQKLLAAVNNLRIAEADRKVLEQDKNALREALIELSEASLRFQKASATEDAEARGALEAASRKAAQALGVGSIDAKEPTAVPATLTDGLVVSVKPELALVVANIGRKHGVRVGMPFRVLRNGDEIGTVRVVDVRELISGALIEDLKSDNKPILAQDRLKVDAER